MRNLLLAILGQFWAKTRFFRIPIHNRFFFNSNRFIFVFTMKDLRCIILVPGYCGCFKSSGFENPKCKRKSWRKSQHRSFTDMRLYWRFILTTVLIAQSCTPWDRYFPNLALICISYLPSTRIKLVELGKRMAGSKGFSCYI